MKIIPFEERFARDFKRLNMDWLESYKLFEPADLKHLDTPLQSIIDPGGRILMAIEDDTVVGTCAIIVKNKNVVELAKLAVSKEAQGKGIGRKLAIESIKQAKDMGARTVNLVSNSKLSTAVRLYESLGFEYAPVPDDTDYETADVYMEFKIS